MAYKLMDISKLFDPIIECGDHLFVNKNKKGILTVYLIFLCLTLIGILLLLIYGHIKAGISMLIVIVPVLGLAAYTYSEQNPVLVIDKNGITLNSKFYPWSNIESVKLEKFQRREGYNHIQFYLKNRKIVTMTVNDLLDQPLKVIAAYIIKYFKHG